jgi:hypothetical protein
MSYQLISFSGSSVNPLSFWSIQARAIRYFSQLFDVYPLTSDALGGEVFGVSLSRLLRFIRVYPLSFWRSGFPVRALLSFLTFVVQLLLGVAFKVLWLLFVLLDWLTYVGMTERCYFRFDSAFDAIEKEVL